MRANLQEQGALCKEYASSLIFFHTLRDGGSLFLVSRVDRLFEIRDTLIENKLAIKEIQFIYHDLDSTSKLVLIEARKSGKEHGLKVLKPIVLEEGDVNG